MSVEIASAAPAIQEQKANDKEYNFRAQEAKYERLLAQERLEKEKYAKELEEARKSRSVQQEEDEDSDPYVDNKRLEKKFSNFEKKLDEKIDKRAEEKAQKLLLQKDREAWLERHPDMSQVLQSHAEKFFEKTPHLAEALLKTPDEFERKKLVYLNIKALGLDKPEQKQSSIQDKVNANMKSPYYQPPTMGNPPYATVGDFSDAGKKNAWEHVQKLKAGLRLG